ncbi:MAG TPA: type II secretion system F family protein [Verrucomicrobiae bacterium]
MHSLHHLLENDPAGGIALLALAFLAYVLIGLLPAFGVLYVIFYFLTLPMRRNERVRVFLDLLEQGMKEGRTPEAAITEVIHSQDRSLGKRLNLVVAHLKQGFRLSQALEQAPRLVPLQVRAMVKTGERIGDVSKVLPACRLLLRDSVSHVRGALNYLLVLAFVATPFTIFIPVMLKVKVLPSFDQVFNGMYEGAALPAFTRFILAQNTVFIALQVCVFLLVWLATLAYLGGPRLRDWLETVLIGNTRWIDSLTYRLPWRRKRLQRDFSGVLAMLLEAGVPEGEAVCLAGESTANAVMRRRAEEIASRLRQGVRLPQALLALRDAGELRWRMANALQSGGGFSGALAGWHEALDAKAFQLEQTAAQVLTTLLVLINGVLVASIVIAMFLPLIGLINKMALW